MEGTGVPHALPFAFWQPQDPNDAENEIEDDMQPKLIIERIDTCLKENGVNHRTERFEIKVTASFHNPLPIPINGGTLQIEWSGLAETLTIPVELVDANEECVTVFTISPSFKGNNKLSAKFQSYELNDIEGYVDFDVEDRELTEY
uniref:Transglutaminase C-terminal domain-containing protein n=1 Tax=Anopheles minimus TaxID=112268 RepID=A0A182WGY8_9DIPT